MKGDDAFGQLLTDHWKGEEVYEIYERDDGLIAMAGTPAGYFAPFDDWPMRAREAVKFVRGRVLDIGCGAGRHSLYLQAEGYEL